MSFFNSIRGGSIEPPEPIRTEEYETALAAASAKLRELRIAGAILLDLHVDATGLVTHAKPVWWRALLPRWLEPRLVLLPPADEPLAAPVDYSNDPVLRQTATDLAHLLRFRPAKGSHGPRPATYRTSFVFDTRDDRHTPDLPPP